MLTKTCARCGGTGQYSYNLRDGSRCYGCEGKGVVLDTPKKKGVKVTSMMEWAEVGDIVKAPGIGMAKVVEILTGTFTRKEPDQIFGGTCEREYSRIVRYESLIDGKVYRNYGYTKSREMELGGRMCRVNKLTNVWHPIED